MASLNTIVTYFLLTACLIAALTLSVPARAATYSFTYKGSGAPFGSAVTDTASGAGSFTITDGVNPATLNDVSGFDFKLSVTYPTQANATAGTDTFHYGLADVTAFGASFSGGTVTSLDLATVVTSAQLNWSETFMVGSLDVGAAFTADGDADIISAGTVTVADSSLPEPMSLPIVALGLSALGLLLHRRVAITQAAG